MHSSRRRACEPSRARCAARSPGSTGSALTIDTASVLAEPDSTVLGARVDASGHRFLVGRALRSSAHRSARGGERSQWSVHAARRRARRIAQRRRTDATFPIPCGLRVGAVEVSYRRSCNSRRWLVTGSGRSAEGKAKQSRASLPSDPGRLRRLPAPAPAKRSRPWRRLSAARFGARLEETVRLPSHGIVRRLPHWR
jgi:hypothetical protein